MHLLPTTSLSLLYFFKEPKFTCDKIGRRRVGSTRDDTGPLDILAWKIGLDYCNHFSYSQGLWINCLNLVRRTEDNLQRLKAKVKTDHCSLQCTDRRHCSEKITGKLSKIWVKYNCHYCFNHCFELFNEQIKFEIFEIFKWIVVIINFLSELKNYFMLINFT